MDDFLGDGDGDARWRFKAEAAPQQEALLEYRLSSLEVEEPVYMDLLELISEEKVLESECAIFLP